MKTKENYLYVQCCWSKNEGEEEEEETVDKAKKKTVTTGREKRIEYSLYCLFDDFYMVFLNWDVTIFTNISRTCSCSGTFQSVQSLSTKRKWKKKPNRRNTMNFCSNLNEKSRKTKNQQHTLVHRRLFHEQIWSIANVAIIIFYSNVYCIQQRLSQIEVKSKKQFLA